MPSRRVSWSGLLNYEMALADDEVILPKFKNSSQQSHLDLEKSRLAWTDNSDRDQLVPMIKVFSAIHCPEMVNAWVYGLDLAARSCVKVFLFGGCIQFQWTLVHTYGFFICKWERVTTSSMLARCRLVETLYRIWWIRKRPAFLNFFHRMMGYIHSSNPGNKLLTNTLYFSIPPTMASYFPAQHKPERFSISLAPRKFPCQTDPAFNRWWFLPFNDMNSNIRIKRRAVIMVTLYHPFRILRVMIQKPGNFMLDAEICANLGTPISTQLLVPIKQPVFFHSENAPGGTQCDNTEKIIFITF